MWLALWQHPVTYEVWLALWQHPVTYVVWVWLALWQYPVTYVVWSWFALLLCIWWWFQLSHLYALSNMWACITTVGFVLAAEAGLLGAAPSFSSTLEAVNNAVDALSSVQRDDPPSRRYSRELSGVCFAAL